MGKTFLGLYAIAHLKGPKLIVVPTRTLIEQWEERLQKLLDLGLRVDVQVVTYHAYETVKNKPWTLVVFDEAHRLPANSFSRLATVSTKYRIGLSGSPYREDGRTSCIVALTGYPVGVDWTEFIRRGLIKKPDIEVRIVSGEAEKIRIAEAESRDSKGTVIVFCDGLGFGARVAARLKCPHIHGQTDDRLKTISESKVAVVSRVGDEGLSVPTLTKTIEVDFLGGSRRQEAQRVGRLLHAEKKGEHLCLMTRVEFDKFEHRFLALEEKGFKVTVREKA
jgi:DNA excision repair protein ERCC-3